MRVVFVFAGILKYKGRLLKQIKTLQGAGHECLLIHGQVEDTPPDYGVYDFRTVPIRLIRDPNKIKNFYNHIRFNFQAAEKIKEISPGAVVCVELYGALSGALARFRQTVPKFVFDCNELFMQMGMGRTKQMFWSPIHNWIFRRADVVMHAEEQRLLYCQKMYKSKAEHFLLENLPQGSAGTRLADKNRSGGPLRAVYLGALLPDRCCEEVIKAFAGIPPEIASCDFIGFGAPADEQSLKDLLSELKIAHVRFLPPVKHSEMFEVLTQYDAGLAFYENINLNQYYCAPNKIYDYLACGVPVISNDYPGLKKVLEDNRVGVCVHDITAASMQAALQKISTENFAGNITAEIRKRYSWQYQADAYCGIFSADS